MMKKLFKRLSSIALILVLLFAMAACGKKEENKQEEKKESTKKTKTETVVEDVEEEIPENQNLLTGLPDLSNEAIGKRPVAVMVNNIMAAMPQYGVEQADIIFEIPVEGDQTRFMALYADYTMLPDICAIRSCRYYFPALAKGFDAFYVHWGCDPTIVDYLNGLEMDRYDGLSNTGGLFGRDQERLNAGYSLEHTGYFAGTRFAETVQAAGSRLELSEGKTDTAFKFNKLNEQVQPEGNACTSVTVNFGAQTAGFTYDEASKTYKKTNCGEVQIDGKTGNQLAFTNVIVLETELSVRDDVGHKEINITGGKNYTGYYVSNGAVQKITWVKENEGAYLKFYDTDGNEIAVNRGKSYIAFNYAGQTTF